MLLPSFRRLNKQDYQTEYQKLVDQLASSLNIAIDSLNGAVNKNISLTDNIAGTLKDINVTVDANGLPTSATQFSLTVANQKIIGTQVIYAQNTANSAIYPTGGIFISFTQTTTGILINNITGLPSGQPFLIRVMAYAQ